MVTLMIRKTGPGCIAGLADQNEIDESYGSDRGTQSGVFSGSRGESVTAHHFSIATGM